MCDWATTLLVVSCCLFGRLTLGPMAVVSACGTRCAGHGSCLVLPLRILHSLDAQLEMHWP